MAGTPISQLSEAPSLKPSDYLIVDNGEVTRKTAVGSLSGTFVVNSSFNALTATVNTLSNSVARLDGSLVQVINLSGQSVTLSLSHLGAYIRKSHTSPHTIIIPTFQAVNFSIGSTMILRNTSTSLLTVSASPTVTLSYFADLSANILEQNAAAQIVCVGENQWDIV